MKNSFTDINSAHQSMSGRDHIVCTRSAHSQTSNCNVDYSLISSDQFPLRFAFNTLSGSPDQPNGGAHTIGFVCQQVFWDNLSNQQIEQYHLLTEEVLNDLQHNPVLADCRDTSCKCVEHTSEIDKLHSDIWFALSHTSEQCIPSRKCGYKKLPGLDLCCKDLHQ